MPLYYFKTGPRPLAFKSFPIYRHSLITLSSTLYNLVTEKASLNKLSLYPQQSILMTLTLVFFSFVFDIAAFTLPETVRFLGNLTVLLSRDVLENLIDVTLANKAPSLHTRKTRKFVTLCTKTCHRTVS
jgi:hypothetical protein